MKSINAAVAILVCFTSSTTFAQEQQVASPTAFPIEQLIGKFEGTAVNVTSRKLGGGTPFDASLITAKGDGGLIVTLITNPRAKFGCETLKGVAEVKGNGFEMTVPPPKGMENVCGTRKVRLTVSNDGKNLDGDLDGGALHFKKM